MNGPRQNGVGDRQDRLILLVVEPGLEIVMPGAIASLRRRGVAPGDFDFEIRERARPVMVQPEAIEDGRLGVAKPAPVGAERLAPDVFFFNDAATAEIYTLSLHDAPP